MRWLEAILLGEWSRKKNIHHFLGSFYAALRAEKKYKLISAASRACPFYAALRAEKIQVNFCCSESRKYTS